jgi:type VI secretion system protein ImpA
VANARWDCRTLLQPLTDERPCGESLEDSELLTSFDTYDLFGHSTPLDAPADVGERRVPKPPEAPVWIEIQEKASDALTKSKDLRLLAHLAAALLRTDGLRAFCDVLGVAASWLDAYWGEVYPRVDEDAFFRRNALSCFADPMAIVDRVRRIPLADSRQYGRVSLRDVEVAGGQVAGDGAAPVAPAEIDSALADIPDDELKALHDGVAAAVAAAKRIDETMAAQAGSDAAPGLDGLSIPLGRIVKVLHGPLARRLRSEDAGEVAESEAPSAAPLGAIRTRDEAVRALDAVAEYFRRSEPSSPVPMLVARARRLVGMEFLDVLADIAPEALASARAAGGVRANEQA